MQNHHQNIFYFKVNVNNLKTSTVLSFRLYNHDENETINVT